MLAIALLAPQNGCEVLHVRGAALGAIRGALSAYREPTSRDAVNRHARRLRVIERRIDAIYRRSWEGYADHEERLHDRDDAALINYEAEADAIAEQYGLRATYDMRYFGFALVPGAAAARATSGVAARSVG